MATTFSFRVKINQYEIEISGTREEVMKTIKELPSLVANISKAFEGTEIKIETPKSAISSTYPTLSSSLNCSEPVLELLGSDWGKQPITMTEFMEAMKVNAIHYPSTTLFGCASLVGKKEQNKRWKTDKGYVNGWRKKWLWERFGCRLRRLSVRW